MWAPRGPSAPRPPWLRGVLSLRTVMLYAVTLHRLRQLSGYVVGLPRRLRSRLPPGGAQAQHLVARDGLFLGSSAAVNCVGALRVARLLGRGHTIVTILCDGGHRCPPHKEDTRTHDMHLHLFVWPDKRHRFYRAKVLLMHRCFTPVPPCTDGAVPSLQAPQQVSQRGVPSRRGAVHAAASGRQLVLYLLRRELPCDVERSTWRRHSATS